MPPTSEPTNVIDQTAQIGGAQPGGPHTAGTPSGAKPRESSGASRAHPLSLEIPIGVQGSRRITSAPGQPEKLEQFSEDTRTVIVFPQGAVIRLGAAVAQGQMLVITNRQSQQEVLCTILNVKNHANVKGYVEIEFNQPMNGFWGVYFPEESKGAGSPIQPPLPGPPPVSAAAPAQRQTVPAMEMPSGNGKPSVEPGLPASAPPAAKTNTPAGTLTSDFWGSSFPEEILTPAAAASSEKRPTIVPPAQNNAAPVPANGSPAVPAAPPARPANVPTPEEIWNASLSKEGAKVPVAPKIQAPVPVSSASIGVSPAARPQQNNSPSAQALISMPMEVKTEPLAEASATLMPPAARHADDWRAGNAQQSPLSSMSDLLGTKVDAPYASTTHHTAHPPNRMGMMVGVGVIVLAAIGAGIYFKGSSSKAPAATATAPVTAPSTSATTSAPANEQPSALAASDTASATKTPPPAPVTSASLKSELPPAKPSRTQQVASAQPAPAEQPQPKPAWNGALPSGKLAKAPAVRVTGSVAPPDLAAAGNNSISGIQGLLGANSNAAPAPPPVASQPRLSDLKEPRLLSSVTPVYPTAARVAQVEGVVVINGVVDEAGHVTNAKAVSGPQVLRGAALDAVSKWRYQPGVINGKPSKMELNITVQFHLR